MTVALVIPVYRNSANIPSLLAALEKLVGQVAHPLEVTFVVDGSPDDSYLKLAAALPEATFSSSLVLLSRNYGSFAAIRAGLEVADADYYAVMAADLQEPPELIVEFVRHLTAGDCDVVVGKRIGRADPLFSRLMSSGYWWLYRRLVQPEVPEGGIDVFACHRLVRDQILRLTERNSSLVGLLVWVGFRRVEVEYARRARELGRSAWTFKKKVRYLADSVFSFTDLPIRLLTAIGLLGLTLSVAFALTVLLAYAVGSITVPGYTATVIVVTFFGALNCFGLGVVGGYVARTFENTKGRPGFIVASTQRFMPRDDAGSRSASGAEDRAPRQGG